jgi:hypothetical protein
MVTNTSIDIGSQTINTVGTITTGTWQGDILDLPFGGTNAALTASNGGIVYSTATSLAILPGVAQSFRALLSGNLSAPTWSNAAYPVSTTINQLLYSSANNTIVGLPTANNGVVATNASGVPSVASALPSAVQGNITSLGTITTGVWNGSIIPMQFGGSGANLTASAGAIPYSTSSALALLAPTTSNKVFMSGNGAIPAWSSATYPVSTTINQLLYSSAANVITGLTAANNATLMTNSSGVPAFQTTASNFVTSLTPTPNQISVSSSTGAVTVSLASSIHLGATGAPAARMHLEGGVQNVSGEDSVIRAQSSSNAAKIEINCTGGTGRLYELSATNSATAAFIDRTGTATKWVVNASGLGFGASAVAPLYDGDCNGTFRSKRLLGNGNTPTFTLSANAGAGATASMSGCEMAGQFSITTTAGGGTGTWVIFTLASAMPNTNYSVIFSAENPNAATLTGNLVMQKTSTTQFQLIITGLTIPLPNTYIWNYLIIGST